MPKICALCDVRLPNRRAQRVHEHSQQHQEADEKFRRGESDPVTLARLQAYAATAPGEEKPA